MYKKYITKKGKKIGPYFYESVRLKDGSIKTIYLGRDEQVALQKVRALKDQKNGKTPHLPAQDQLPYPQTQSPPSREQQLRDSLRECEQRQKDIQEKASFLRQQHHKKIITPELYQQKYTEYFGQQDHKSLLRHYDSQISVYEQELLHLRQQRVEQEQHQRLDERQEQSTFRLNGFQAIVILLLFFGGLLFFQQPSLTGLSFLFPFFLLFFVLSLTLFLWASLKKAAIGLLSSSTL